MFKRTTALVLGLLFGPLLPLTAQAQTAITAEEAHAIGVDAYLYFYPLLSMEISRQTFTNVEPGKVFGRVR